MPRIPLPDRLLAGPFTFSQGLKAGMGEKRLRGRDLQRPFRGVRSPQSGRLTLEGLCEAYQKVMPQHAFFCGVTAATLMAIPLPSYQERSRTLHVAVPAPHRAPSGRGVRGHTLTPAPDQVRDWHGLRLSSPEFTWCQLGALLPLPGLVAAGDFLIHHRLPFTTTDRLTDAVDRFVGRRGKPALRAALLLLNNRSESPQESQLRVIVVTSGIPGAQANLPITTSGGYRYRADIAFPEKKVIVEYQSRFHDGSKEFRADMTRISRLEADDWYVMQVNRNDLDGPVELISRLRRVLSGR